MKTAADVMTQEVISIRPDATVAEAMRVMHEKGVSSLLVEPRDEADTYGFMSRRDIVEKIIAQGRNPKECLIADIMSKPLITVPPTATLQECAQVMEKHRIRRVVVCEGERIVGIVSNTDLLRATTEEELSSAVS